MPKKNEIKLFEGLTLPSNASQVKLIKDDSEPGRVLDGPFEGLKLLRRYSAVGAIADTVYQSGRIIPSSVQKEVVDRKLEDGSQLTAYIGHPYNDLAGDVRLTAAIPIVKSFNDAKETMVEFGILDMPEGEQLCRIIDSGIRMGVSQRASGTSKIEEVEIAEGVSIDAQIVTSIYDVFGYDFVQLGFANAGDRTALRQLEDSVAGRLLSHKELEAIGYLIPKGNVSVPAAVTDDAPPNKEAPPAEPKETNPDDLELYDIALTDEELQEFAPMDLAGFNDKVLPSHKTDKADPKLNWNPPIAYIDKLPDAAFTWLSDDYLRGNKADRKANRVLPHHTTDMKVVLSACRSGIGLINGARGGTKIPAADRKAAYTHLADHIKQFGLKPPPLKEIKDAVEDPASRKVQPNMNLKQFAEALLSKIEDCQTMVELQNPNLHLAKTDAEKDESLTDSLRARLEAEDDYDRSTHLMYGSIRLAHSEVTRIMESDVEDSVKYEKLDKLGSELSETMDMYTKAFVRYSKTRVDGGDGLEGDVKDSKGAPRVEDEKALTDSRDTPEIIEEKKPAEDPKEPVTDSTYVPPEPEKKEEPPTAPKKEEVVCDSTVLDRLAAHRKMFEESQKINDRMDYLSKALARQKLSVERTKLLHDMAARQIKSSSTNEDIEQIIKDSLGFASASEAEIKFKLMGGGDASTSKGEGSMPQKFEDATTTPYGGDHLKGVKIIADSAHRCGHEFNITKKDQISPKLKEVLDRFDHLNRRALAEETRMLEQALSKEDLRDGIISDASVTADVQTPAILSRMVLQEAYADQMIERITDYGTMSNDRDLIPILKWRREEPNGLAPSIRPNVFQRYAVKVGEFQPIASGKMVPEMHPISASSFKFGTAMSLEYLSRAQQHKQLAGVALAIKGVSEDVQRSVMMDIFYHQIWAAAYNGSTPFTYASPSVDGTQTVFRVIGTDSASAVTIVPNEVRSPLVVEVGTSAANRTAVPEYGSQLTGGGPGQNYFYEIDYSEAMISFVAADRSPLAPPAQAAAGSVSVTGLQATAETRFDLTPVGGEDVERQMARLNFQIGRKIALHAQGGVNPLGYYDPNIILTSLFMETSLRQSRMFSTEASRAGYSYSGNIKEGNAGITCGLGHWTSKLFPNQFLLIGDDKACIHRQYVPPTLKGPAPVRNSSGQQIGGEEYFVYSELATSVPIEHKYSMVTFFNS